MAKSYFVQLSVIVAVEADSEEDAKKAVLHQIRSSDSVRDLYEPNIQRVWEEN